MESADADADAGADTDAGTGADADWWREFVISAPRPIPEGYGVGLRDEIRDGIHYVVEFLEKGSGYQPNPFTTEVRRKPYSQLDLCIDLEDSEGNVLVSWSKSRGFVVIDEDMLLRRRYE